MCASFRGTCDDMFARDTDLHITERLRFGRRTGLTNFRVQRKIVTLSHSKEDFVRPNKLCICCILLGMLVALFPATSSAKVLRGFQGIELGMKRSQAIDVLQGLKGNEPAVLTEPNGFSFLVKNSKLFRHAHYRFDENGILTEILLTMREVLGKEKILEELNKTYNLELVDKGSVVREGVIFSVQGNDFSIKDANLGIAKTSADGRGPTR